jgi:hypothetical protein
MIFDGYDSHCHSTGPARSAGAESAARSAKTQVAELGFEVERLLMITEALWGILKEHHGYKDEELARRVAEIDLRDGKLDGKVAKTAPARCQKCSRALNRKHSKCLYCGTEIGRDTFAR